MKSRLIIILLLFLGYKNLVFSQNKIPKSIPLPQAEATTTQNFAERKFTHISEFGFLLGKQAPINNIAYPAYDVKYAASSYYPYPYYYGDDQYSNFTFQHFSGYNVHKTVAVGLTAAFDYYRSNIITPLSLGIRTKLLPSRRISPIGNIDAGYGFIWNNTNDKNLKIDKEGGFMLNPSAGLRILLGNDGSSLNINVGYKMQNSKMENNQPDQNYYQTEYRSFNRLSIRLGIGF